MGLKWTKALLAATILSILLVIQLIWSQGLHPKDQSTPGLDFKQAQPTSSYTYLNAANAHLMGTAPIKVVDPKPVQEIIAPTPVTHLTLLGTITDATPNLASAFIAVSGQSSKRVFVGKNISGEIKLIAVERDYVTIERSEKLELLYFPNGAPKTMIIPPNKRQIQKMDQNSAEQLERSDLFNPGMEALEQLRKNLGTE